MMKKTTILAICILIFPGAAQSPSEDIPEDQKKQFIEQLGLIQDAAANKKNKLIQAGIAALTPAASNESEAMNLFERCHKKVEFDDKGKKDKEWREWKTQNKDRMASQANKKALKFQIQWTLLMLKAGLEPDEKYDSQQYAAQAITLMREIFKDPKLVGVANSPYTSPIPAGSVGKMYELESCKRNGWPDNIMEPRQVIENLILKTCREKKDYAGLRKGWNELIALEKARQDLLAKNGSADISRSYMVSSSSGGVMTFIADDSSDTLTWDREVDCFRCGERMTAAGNMLRIIKATQNSKEQTRYAKELETLLESDKADSKNTAN